jgi:hypothetical protein
VASVLFTSALLGLGCSWMTAFAVSNRSETPIEITYSYSGPFQTCPFVGSKPPAVASTETMGWWRPHAEWTELDRSQYRVDLQVCSIGITLPPNTAVRIARELNYTGHQSGRWGILADLSLTISAPSGEITLTGFELVRSFSKRSDALYEFSYQSPNFLKESDAA